MKKYIHFKDNPKDFSWAIKVLILAALFLPMKAWSQQNAPEPTLEEAVRSLQSEIQLSGQEQLILQPVLDEITVYYKALNEILRQWRLHESSLEQKLAAFTLWSTHVLERDRKSIHEENTFQAAAIRMLAGKAPGLVFDPGADDKSIYKDSAFTRPWGWVKFRDLPDKVNNVVGQNNERLEQWNQGVTNINFHWPELPGYTGLVPNGRLEEFRKKEAQKIRDLATNPAMDAFAVFYPNLEWVGRKKIQDHIRVAREKLLQLRDQVRKGTLRMRSQETNLKDRTFLVRPARLSADDLQGWVTKEQIRERIGQLEKKLATVREQYKTGTLRINRKHTGWVNQADILASLEAIRGKVEAVNKQIAAGDYPVYFPALKKYFTKKGFDEEMNKISEHIKEINHYENYCIPVDRVGMEANREMVMNVMKRKGTTREQRAYLQLKLGHIAATQTLEREYYLFLQNHMNQLENLFFDHSQPISLATGYGQVKGLSGAGLTTAMPFMAFQQWDFKQRERFQQEFLFESEKYDFYYRLKIDYLKKCLDL